MREKNFHVGDILSLAMQRNLSPNGMYGVFGLLNFMFGGEKLELPSEEVYEECRHSILSQYPQFASAEIKNAEQVLVANMTGVPIRYAKQVTGLWLQKFISGEFGIQCEKMMPIREFPSDTKCLLQRVNY